MANPILYIVPENIDPNEVTLIQPVRDEADAFYIRKECGQTIISEWYNGDWYQVAAFVDYARALRWLEVLVGPQHRIVLLQK